jgi:mobilization protein NikA
MPKQTKKQTSPFCLRLTPEERALLEREAAGLPLGEYVRQRVFDENRIERRTRNKHPVKDHLLLSQLLGELGRSKMANNLNQLAKTANSGLLIVTPEVKTALLNACADIRHIRQTLMKSLGLDN